MNYQEQLAPLDEFNQSLRENVHPIDWKNPKPSGRYNLVVIGAGTAGLVTAAGAAGLGAKVALIERGLMGGDCLNVGCVPSKAILSSARMAAKIRKSREFGILTNSVEVDFEFVMQRMRRLRASISPHDSAKRFTELGVDVYFGQGTFCDSETVEVAGQKLRFKKAVIATGARASEFLVPGIQGVGYLTNETLFSMTQLPKRLVVIGGGPIGCEMAQCFARLGSQVTQIEKSDRVLAREERDAAAIVQASMRSDSVQFVLNAQVTRVDKQENEKIVFVEQQGREMRIACDEILVAIGRTPNLDGLGLDAVGVDFDTKLGVKVDDRLRTSNPKIFAAGDVCTRYKFTHAADFLARIVIQNTLFMGRSRASRLVIPWCTYTSPEIAHVGIYPEEFAPQDYECSTFTQPLSGVDRAILDAEQEGFVRVYCNPKSDRILGATVVAEHAGELIGEISLAIKNGIGLKRIASSIHPYPTQADAIRKLGDQYSRTRLTPMVKRLFHSWLAWSR